MPKGKGYKSGSKPKKSGNSGNKTTVKNKKPTKTTTKKKSDKKPVKTAAAFTGAKNHKPRRPKKNGSVGKA